MTPVIDITKGSLLSKLLRHGSLYFVGNLIMRSVQLLLIPLDTRLFTADEYGTIVTITSTTRVMLILVGLYLDAAYNRFYHDYKHDPALLQRYVSTIYWFVMGWGLLTVAGALVVVEWVADLGIPTWPVFVLAFMGPLFTQLAMMSQAYLQQNHRSGLQVSVNLMNVALNIGVMVLAVGVFKVGMVGKFLGIFAGTGLSFILGTIILSREGYLRPVFSVPMLLQSLRFSIPLLPNLAAGWITSFSDRLLLSLYGPAAETGVYNVGYSLGMGLSLFSFSIFMVYGPMIASWMKKDRETASHQIERFAPYYYALMLWICLALSLLAREIVDILTPSAYAEAATIVPIVLFAYFLGSQYQISVTVLSFEKKTGIISLGAIMQAIINLGANLALIPLFGKLAAAWTTVAAVGCYTAWMVYWSHRFFPFKVQLRRIVFATVVIGGAVPIHLLVNRFGATLPWLSLPSRLVLLLLVALVLWFGGLVEPRDRVQLHLKIRSLLNPLLGRLV